MTRFATSTQTREEEQQRLRQRVVGAERRLLQRQARRRDS